MKSTLFASILLFASSAFSAPLSPGTPTLSIRNNTAPAPFSQTTIAYPDLQVRWKSKDPATKGRNTNTGHLLNSPNEQVHTAVYFNLGKQPNIAGKTCKLAFHLSQNDWAINLLGNAPPMFDLYRLDGCLNEGYSWTDKLARGAHAGILTPKKGTAAWWQSVDMSADTTFPAMKAAPTFPCDSGEYSFEMIGRPGANIGWTTGSGSGLRIEICG
ncbi:hypothetical protein IQ06DRAFT_294124 [Phaeosphaeriaceae sp. SRC1lsM3a]|nr:hypothetical protein IQ06DRAFT_294124 [Stagonospora sp. SRC1lsM3a]